MKNYLMLVVITFVFGCEKEPSMPKTQGTISVTKNGLAWSPLIIGDSYDNSSLVLRIDVYNGPIRIESLRFDRFPKQPGVYRLSTTPSMRMFYSTLDHDAICDPYKIDTSDSTPDFFEITQIESNRMAGRFQCSFNFDSTGGRQKCNVNASDKIIFSCTAFDTKIVKVR